MKYTFTLTRWHKVAERIQLAVREREAAVKNAFTATTISPWNKEAVEEKAADIVGRAVEDLSLIEAGLQAIATIRAALGVRNAQLGITAKLAEAESANRRAALYKAVIDGQKADMVRPADVRALPVEAGSESDKWVLARRSVGTITLQTADKAFVGGLRAKLEQEQVRATRLLDEVADLNREMLEVEVPDAVVRIAGLAA